MHITKYERLFSTPRMARYISACGGNENSGLQLYKYNIQASQALYPVLSILEVALRNSISRALCDHYSDADWLINHRSDFAENPLLTYKDLHGKTRPDFFFRDKLVKAERKLERKGHPVNHVKLMAEMTFGFWVKFFDPVPIKILNGAPLHAFDNRPRTNLRKVHSLLNAVLKLRNRISHSEPICFDHTGKICTDSLLQYRDNIGTVLYWLDSDLSAWSDKMNYYLPVVNRIALL